MARWGSCCGSGSVSGGFALLVLFLKPFIAFFFKYEYQSAGRFGSRDLRCSSVVASASMGAKEEVLILSARPAPVVSE